MGGANALREAIFLSNAAEPILLPPVDQLSTIAEILAMTPAFAGANNVAISIFNPETTDQMLQTLQADAANAIVTGVIGLGAGGGSERELEKNIDVLLKTVLSVDEISRGVRDSFSGRKGWGAHEIPRDLLDALERLEASTCYAGVRQAMMGLAGAIAGESPNFDKGQQILSIKPADACPGETVHIEGIGFGAVQDGQKVMFTGAHHTSAVVGQVVNGGKNWSDTAIDVVVPAGAGRGPVAIARIASNGASTVASAATELAGATAKCFGKAAGGVVVRLQNMMSVPVMQLPNLNTNMFKGGPPEIKRFEVAGRSSNLIWPNGSLTLSWEVEGADKITITPERVGNEPNELPQIPGGQLPAGGSFKVMNIPGTSKWSGAYRLVAINKCGRHEQALNVMMVRRVGLALSGGGSRGAFQLGALDYLYNLKGMRPDAISSTSVGSVNALQLVMGDATAKNAVEQLKDIWLGLQNTSDMWLEQPWLKAVKQSVRDAIKSFGWWDLAFFPLTAAGHTPDIISKINGIQTTLKGADAFFNLSPIEAKMVAVFSQARVQASGISARFIAVSLKTGEIVKVDEKGNVLATGGGTASLIDAAIASSIMPGIFPARKIGAHFCVDGGIREIIPVQYCIDDMGTNVVYAIACSAKTLADTRPNWKMVDVMTRSMMGINFDEIVKDDIAPHGGWPEGVFVKSIFPRFNIFDPIMIEPGLIRIAMDYGWMCAADEIDTTENGKETARIAADQIIQLRLQNWADRYAIEDVVSSPDPHAGFLPAITNGFLPPARPSHSEVRGTVGWYMTFVMSVRDRCKQIRTLAAKRLAAGGALPTTRATWWQQWEVVPVAAQRNTEFWGLATPWQGLIGGIDPETPPGEIL